MIPREVIYVGKIMHLRLIPKKHKFQYSFFSFLLDIDCLQKPKKDLRLLSINRFNIFSFYEKDHGSRDGSALRVWADDQLKKNKMPVAERIFLLSFPRMFGYVFNPFSAYFCYSGGILTSIIYEVKNTFGDQITYIKAIELDGDNLIQHNQEKKMYVSPFIEMDQIYFFSLKPPGKKLSIRIDQSGKEGETLIATQTGKAIELSNVNLLWCLITYPLMTLKVILGIHWEALLLLVKGMKLHKHNI